MALRGRMRMHQQLGCIMTRSFMMFLLVGILFYGPFLSHWVLRPRPMARWITTRGGFRLPNSDKISNATMLRYSQFYPELSSQRDKINFLLQVTKFGKIGMKEALEFWKIPSKAPLRTSRNSRYSWILPLKMGSADRYMPEFYKLSKAWLGDEGDSTPRVMQDFLQTVKTALEESVTSSTSNNQTQKDKVGGLKATKIRQSCAVVGNSGILLKEEYGEEIDSHDVVVRVNNAKVSYHERHVGSKTSLSFINSNVLHDWSVKAQCQGHNYAKGIPIVLYICQPNHFLDVAKCMYVGMQKALDKSLFVTPTLFDATCGTIAKWYSITNFLRTTGRALSEWDSVHDELQFHYSSGMQAVVLALGICDRVDMFGFGKAPNATHHYHTSRTEELSLHDYAAEYVFYDDLVHNRTVPFLTDAGISIPPVRIFV